MPWKVQSTIIGGKALSASKEQEYLYCSNQLKNLSYDFNYLSENWLQAYMRIMSITLVKNSCDGPFCNISDSINTSLSYEECRINSQECKLISEKLLDLSELIARANSLYSNAELSTRNFFDNTVSLCFTLIPSLSIPMLVSAGISLNSDKNNSMTNFAKWSNATAPLQQGFIRGISNNILINPITGFTIHGLNFMKKAKLLFNNGKQDKSIIFNNFSRSSLSEVSAGLSSITSRINNYSQGNKLTVSKINIPNKSKTILPKNGQSIKEALTNITELSSGNIGVHPPLANSEAATIAIQCFKKKDGSKSWLVTIPGTDGKPHSPFGWEQNAEVMSAYKSDRVKADSARMVISAMKKAGIQKNDPVALIGHSQGGIVAAAIASDYSKEYNIQHVVTAGSPIANHNIPEKTWVTSIEMEDELVANLDGKSNPSRSNWVTIRAKATHFDRKNIKNSKKSKENNENNEKYDISGVTVKGIDEKGTLTHDLHYHQAAYEDASTLGSSAILNQENHFKNIVDGKLESTTLWQGVMNK